MKLIVILVAMLSVAVPCFALDLNNDALMYSAGGMTATYNWDNSDTWLQWNITSVDQDTWHYEYVWNTGGADLSHVILELSEGAVAGDFENWEFAAGATLTFGVFSPSDPGNSNPNMPGSIYGVKLGPVSDVAVFAFSFDTWRSPVWGDFYAKDGRHDDPSDVPDAGRVWTTAWNNGYLLADANDDQHIARPDGGSVRVPDGGLTVLLLGMSLLGIEALRRRLHSRS